MTPDASFCEYCGKPLYSCKSCGTTIAKEALFCPECGAAVTQEGRELAAREHVSWVWWVLPIGTGLLAAGWIGGLVAWAFNRNRDSEKATSMLWLGLTLSLIEIVAAVVLNQVAT